MNYYNEWDKPTAAWLQELILIQVQKGRSACGQSVHDMLDIRPKPFQATCNFWSFAILQNVRVQACAQYLKHDIRHKIRSISARSYCTYGIESGWSLEAFSLWFLRGISPLLLDYVDETPSQTLCCWPAYIRQNITTYCAVPCLSENASHICGIRVPRLNGLDFSVANALCIALSSTFGGCATLASPLRTERISAVGSSLISTYLRNFT